MMIGRSIRAELLAERLVAPVDVGGVVDDRLRGIDEAGRSDSDRRDIRLWQALAQVLDHLDDDVDDQLGVSGGGGAAILSEDAAELVDQGSGDLRPADVDPDRVHANRLSDATGTDATAGPPERRPERV